MALQLCLDEQFKMEQCLFFQKIKSVCIGQACSSYRGIFNCFPIAQGENMIRSFELL